MNQDEIIEMARQADVWVAGQEPYQSQLEAFAKLVAMRTLEGTYDEMIDIVRKNEREACESIEYDLAKSPAMFATMAEYKSYRDGVEKYRAAIRARGEA